MRRFLALAVLVAFSTSSEAQVRTERVFPDLTFEGPLGLAHDGVHPSWRYVVEQRGVIHVVEGTGGDAESAVFLDIRDRVNAVGEQGLLGLAFDPNYAENGYFYVYYSTPPPHRSRVSRVLGDTRGSFPPAPSDFADEEVLLEIGQPYGNHNGGHLAFGPDGHLYVALGDGGGIDGIADPDGNGQDPTTLLGSILRLDVHGGGGAPDCGGAGARYTVPASNALADGPGGTCDEIWAYGLRNPWRFSFDRATGEVWIADVGQAEREEVNLGQNGANFGWKTYEGTLCYDGPCEPAGLTFPIWEYAHEEGDYFQGCSITGGYVYRGTTAPELAGRYVYGDYCTGTIWALQDTGAGVENERLGVGPFGVLTSFGEDASGELYIVQSTGEIHRFIGEAVSAEAPAAPGEVFRLGPAAPNPFTNATSLPLHLPTPVDVRVAVYDVLGREVAVLHDGPLRAGEHAFALRAGALAPGLYVVRAEAGRAVQTRRVVRAR